MKKILLLGGSAQQVVAIKTAKELGYYTVLCDYLPDNPGQYVADKFYLASTTDKNLILKIAKQENIDGIISYVSDPAAPTASYIARELNLLGNSLSCVDTLCNKGKFRNFLEQNGFNTPHSLTFNQGVSVDTDALSNLRFPLIIKPVDSSGSKGVTVLDSSQGLTQAISYASEYSRSKTIIVEEFVQKKHPYLIGGDIFVKDGKVVLWGLMNCHRDENCNSLIPVGKSYPLCLDDADIDLVKQTLQSLVDKVGFINGEMNVELVIDKSDRVWPLDIGPRAGGNMIPDMLSDIFGIDLVKANIESAMNSDFSLDGEFSGDNCYFATHNLHSIKKGVFDSVTFSPELEKYIYKKHIYKKRGDKVNKFNNAANALGILFMKFDSKDQMHDIINNINQHVSINLKEDV